MPDPASPEQLTILQQVVEEYCLEHRVSDASEREHVAARVIAGFRLGNTTAEALKKTLAGTPGGAPSEQMQ